MSRISQAGKGYGLVAVLLLTSLAGTTPAADKSSFREIFGLPPAGRSHSHDPVEIEAAPILSRYRVPLIRPRRVISGKNGTLYVADWGAGVVIRVSPKGKASVLAQDLDEPAGLALDSAGNLYVATHAQGMTKEGAIYRITRDGMKSVFAIGFSGPTDLAFDSQDNLYVANFHDSSISRVTPGGAISTYVANIAAPSSLLFDSAGDLLVLSSTEGTIYKVTQMGDVKPFARGLSSPTDLARHPDGHVIAVDFGRHRVMHVTAKGKLKVFAIVPKGTIAAEFDRIGNLIIANWDKPGLLKITTILKVKCPHCGRAIPVQLRTRPRPAARDPKSEQKPGSPVI